MTKSVHLALAALIVTLLYITPAVTCAADKASIPNRWRITSIKICRSPGGSIYPAIEAVGSYPVYTFFIPRPVWTVNGSVVQAKPIYANGRLVSFQLFGAAAKLNPGIKNTVKFALPDQNGSSVFLYDHSRVPSGECYEFF